MSAATDLKLKQAYWRSVAKTSSYAITGQDTQSSFTNQHAAGNTTLTLPKAVAGNSTLQYQFLVTDGHTITVTPKIATDTIRGKAAGASATNNGIGSFLWLVCIQTGFWEPIINIGAW
jgi:hypothetical protein